MPSSRAGRCRRVTGARNGGHIDLILPNFPINGGAIDTEYARGVLLIPLGKGEYSSQVICFKLIEGKPWLRSLIKIDFGWRLIGSVGCRVKLELESDDARNFGQQADIRKQADNRLSGSIGPCRLHLYEEKRTCVTQ